MRRSTRQGFTIIELLLALMLTSLLTAALSAMIGQAAHDRGAMQRPDETPAWATSVIGLLEDDLKRARWWAGTDDRLVLIGLGRGGTPARIEYHWRADGESTAWSRLESPLTQGGSRNQDADERVLALNLAGLAIGPHHFGATESLTIGIAEPLQRDEPQTNKTDRIAGVSLVIDGVKVPLHAVPDQVPVRLVPRGDDTQTVERGVVLR